MTDNEIFVLVGKTMSGKTTLIKNTKNDLDANFIISFTTRPKRENEEHKVDYYFINDSLAKSYIDANKVIAHRVYKPHKELSNDVWHYGLFLYDFTLTNDKKILVTDPKGLLEIKDKFKNVTTIYLNITEDEQMKRISKRGSNLLNEQKRRILDDNKEFKENLKNWDYELDASKNEEDLKKELIQIVNGE